MSQMNLLALPHDVLLYILQQDSLDPRSLCRLESTCRTLRQVIDERIWRRAFLGHRHCNALHPPASWKAEYARRTAWSRDWRGLSGTHPHARAPPAHKLRRFALKVMSGGVLSRPPRPHTHSVDPSDPACHATIHAALLAAAPFDRVLVREGVYRERLRLDRSVEIVGAGRVGSTVIIGSDGPTVETLAKVSVRLHNLTILQQPRAARGASMSGAVFVKGGSLLVMEECAVSSETGHALVVQGLDSCAYVLHNLIERSKGVGVLVCDFAKGLIEDNVIASNGRAGVAILSGGDPIVSANKIHDGLDSGVLVSEKGRGRVEDNDIFGNRRAGVAILKEGAPLVKRNRIHDGKDSGVLVCENGKGAVVDNDIFANKMAGVAIGRGGASLITGNTIRDGNGGSLCLSAHSKGLIASNVIHEDPRAAMQVPEGLLTEVTQKNQIRYWS
ncbi:hypothetical protein AB1Y20_016510 [Prymnesium parvum]|uniref:F-box domain-containing protein n=1 Tax=Prymnesium parvum TaxID=97485 RepID=A0AB34ICL2_PRYPA